MLLIRICMTYPCVFCCSDWCQFPGRRRPVATQLGIGGVRHRANGKLTWATHCILTETMFRIDACASQVEYLCAHRADVNRGLRSSSLHYAACFARPQIVRAYCTSISVSVEESLFYSLFLFLVLRSCWRCVKTRLEIISRVHTCLLYRYFASTYKYSSSSCISCTLSIKCRHVWRN